MRKGERKGTSESAVCVREKGDKKRNCKDKQSDREEEGERKGGVRMEREGDRGKGKKAGGWW